MGFNPESQTPLERANIVLDLSKIAEGEDDEHGAFRHDPIQFVTKAEPGRPMELRSCYLSPRNWHYSESDKPLFDEMPGLKDRRLSVALISDYEHAFQGWTQRGPATKDHAFLDDWEADQKSTRVIDYLDPKGRTALISQLCKVVDDLRGEYTLAIPIGPEILGGGSGIPAGADPDLAVGSTTSSSVDFTASGGKGFAAAGYTFDGQVCGLLSTVFAPINPADILGAGREGTQIGIQGLRRTAHFEWGDKHGSLHLSKVEIGHLEESSPDGALMFKASLAHDASAANNPGQKESGQWRPWYKVVYFSPEIGDGVTSGPISEPIPGPGGGGTTPHGATGTPVALVIPGSGFGMSPSLGNIANEHTQAHMIFSTGQGPANDRTVAWSTQGDGTGSPEWGWTLPTCTQLGVNIDDDPKIRIGDSADDHIKIAAVGGVSPRLDFMHLNAAGTNVPARPFRFQGLVQIGPSDLSVNPKLEWGVGAGGTVELNAGASRLESNLGMVIGTATAHTFTWNPFGATGTGTARGNLEVTGKLTVGGVIDPTAMIFSGQAARPAAVTTAGSGLWMTNAATPVLTFYNGTTDVVVA